MCGKRNKGVMRFVKKMDTMKNGVFFTMIGCLGP